MGIELTVLVLLIIGLAFMVLEAIVPTFGMFLIGGALSFIAALVMLYDLETFYGLSVDGPLLAALGILGIAILAGSFYFIRLALKTKTSAGAETMIGMTARVVEWHGSEGRVHADGETWSARGPAGVASGENVTITARDHLTLTVEKQG